MNKRLRLPLVAAALFGAGPADAALVDCRPPEPAPYVVYLSEPQFTPSAFRDRQQMLRFFDRLHQHLDQRRDLEMAGIAEVNFRVARCERRVPAIDGADFTDNVVGHLYRNNVVVEIWGALDMKRGAGNRRQPTAQMNYLLVPIRHGILAGSEKVPAIHRFDYPDREIFATDFVELVSNADLYAFVATAIGVSAFYGDEFALAHQMLCRATAQLARTESRLASAPQTKSQGGRIGQLRMFLAEFAGKSIVEARKRGHAAPALRLQDPANPCPVP